MTYTNIYPMLTFTPIFGRNGDFIWIEEVRGAWPEHDSEFVFVRSAVHDQRVDRLKEENEKLRELIRKAVSLASEHCEPYQPCDGVCDSWDDVVIQEDGKPTRFTCEMGVIYGVMEDLGIEPKL